MYQQYNVKTVVGLSCGIVSLVFWLIGLFTVGIGGIIGLFVGVVGLVFSILGRKEAPSGMAIAGLVCSIVGIALCTIFGLGCYICYCYSVNVARNSLNDIYNMLR